MVGIGDSLSSYLIIEEVKGVLVRIIMIFTFIKFVNNDNIIITVFFRKINEFFIFFCGSYYR